jgi:hypothetical protein
MMRNFHDNQQSRGMFNKSGAIGYTAATILMDIEEK